MAEIKYPGRGSALYIRFDDGTAMTPLTTTPDHIVDGSITYTPKRPRTAENIMTQSAGETIHYDGTIKLAGPGLLKFKLVYRDQLNVTDKTAYNLMTALFLDSWAGAWSAAVSTNPTPGGYRKCVDAILLHKNMKTVSTDFTGTVACTCVELGELTIENGVYVYQVGLELYEETVWT